MATTVFANPVNNVNSTTVSSAYTASSTTLNVVDASTFGSAFPIRISTFRNGVPLSILKVTNIVGNVMTTAGSWGSYPDVNLNVGDEVDLFLTAESVKDLNTAVNAAETNITANTSSIATKAGSVVPTTVKTTNYTALAQDFVPVDTTSGAITITLPTAPADKVLLGVKMIGQGSTNTVTIASGGSDVFNTTGGPTTRILTLLNQAIVLQYKASSGIWYVLADDLPLAQLDTRYAPQASPSFTGTMTIAALAGILKGTAGAVSIASAGTDYLPITGGSGVTTLGTIASGVWNGTTIALINGGTGATTQAGAINATLPTQTSNTGKYLTTDGTNATWATVAGGGGSPGGSTSQIQYNNAGTFGGAALLTYAASGRILTATAGAIADVPMTSKAFAGQTGNLQEWQDSTGTVLRQVSATGSMTAYGTTAQNLGLATPSGVLATQIGSAGSTTYGYRVSALNAAGETLASTTVTTTTGNATLTAGNYNAVAWTAVSGATSYKVYGRTSGSELFIATVVAPTATFSDTGSLTPAGALPAAPTGSKMVAQAWQSQTGNLQEWQDSGSVARAYIGPFGNMFIQQTSTGTTNSSLTLKCSGSNGSSNGLVIQDSNGTAKFTVGDNGNISMGFSPSLSFSGTLAANQGGSGCFYINASGCAGFGYNASGSGAQQIFVTSNTTTRIGIVIQNTASQSADQFQMNNSSSAVQFAHDKLGRPYTANTTPAIAAGTGAGTTPTVSISGTDVNGVITVTTGTTPTASATVATVTFSAAYALAPKTVMLQWGNVNAAALSGTSHVFVDDSTTTTTTFALTVGAGGLTASTTYKFKYITMG